MRTEPAWHDRSDSGFRKRLKGVHTCCDVLKVIKVSRLTCYEAWSAHELSIGPAQTQPRCKSMHISRVSIIRGLSPDLSSDLHFDTVGVNR